MLSGQKDGLSDGMLDVGWWILDGGFWMVDGQHATEHRGPRFPIPGSQFPIPKFPCISDVCGRAKMYSFWDVFNFSLKSLSDVVRSLGFFFYFIFPYFFPIRLPSCWHFSPHQTPLCWPSLAAICFLCLSNGVSQITEPQRTRSAPA